jgi:endonuclease YncB( thermonuclease family)
LLLLASTGAALPRDLIGQASIVDGDTLEIHGTRIRLWGIDAPETTQLCRGDDSQQYRCGAKSANELDAYIARRPSLVRRSLAGSIRAERRDLLGRRRRSWGMAGPQRTCVRLAAVSKRKYDAAQRDAEHAGRGMWAGSYVEPWLYRACIRQGGRPTDCSDDASAHP